MSGRPGIKNIARVVGLLILGSILILAGCGTPRGRYRVLSYFFDGVPNPDAPKVVKTINLTSVDLGKPAVAVVSRHKPFVEGKCDSCHRSDSGMMIEFADAYKGCAKCHSTVAFKYPRMHGPVATAACQWCHTPHESYEPALLKGPAIKVCTQCHDQQLLGPKPAQHTDGSTSCITCHHGHGGPEAYFLKTEWRSVVWPSATAPTSATAAAATTAAPVTTGPATPIGDMGVGK